MFKQGSRLRRRPSASMIVSCLALFVALSGGAYAAVIIPNNSVGYNQLKPNAVGFSRLANNAVGTKKVSNNAITYTKIAKGQIGHARVSQGQIQWRVTGKCAGSFAVQSVTDTGRVTCESTLPTNYTTAGLSEPLTSPSSGTALAGLSAPAGYSYDATSTPYFQVSGTGGTQNVVVTCEIAAGAASETRSITFALGTNHEQAAGSISLSLPVNYSTTATEVAVGCVRGYDTGAAPIVQASASLDALQVLTNSTQTTPGTSSTAFSITTPLTTTTAAATTTATTATTATATTTTATTG